MTLSDVLGIFGSSFRWRDRVIVPGGRAWKRARFLLILAVLAASCGSSAKDSGDERVLRGPGFSFSAPATWAVQRTATSVSVRPKRASSMLVSAAVYRIGKAYTPSQFAAAARELDRVAARAAAAAGGTVTRARTSTVAARRGRVYDLDTPRRRIHLGFVLSDRREYQLLCEAPRAAAFPDDACALLFASFALR
jgi:hypothetical protein